jgi:predicted acylesterase/phospholipase RssA
MDIRKIIMDFSQLHRLNRTLLAACITTSLLLIQSCSSIKSYNPLPAELEDQVQVPGFHDIRSWGDTPSKTMMKSALQSIKQEKANNHGILLSEINVLALSGGGQDGAFGAGLLCGWTKAGTRPTFKIVTGISTGALMAPFAFLGSAYDERLKIAYTTISDKDIFVPHSGLQVLLALAKVQPLVSLANNEQLTKMVGRLIDANMLRKIAAEHLKGRRLFIGTSQMNAQRLVIWDMGAIAISGSPEALGLFRKIMIASASLPATFPPQYFDVTAGGKPYHEMHADGGIQTQVMVFLNTFSAFARHGNVLKGHERVKRAYIVRNQKISPEWENVKPDLTYVAIRAISSLTKSQGIGDLFRLYTYAQRDEVDYNVAFIRKDFRATSTSTFDKEYMNKLFVYAYNLGRKGYQWEKYPPLFSPAT